MNSSIALLKMENERSAAVMAEELEVVVDHIRRAREGLSVLLLAPLPVNIGREYQLYYHEQIAKSFELIEVFANVCDR